MYDDYYHQIILRVVQSNYSSLLSKFKLNTPNDDASTKHGVPSFSSIHKGSITLPPYVCTSCTYQSFEYVNDRDGIMIILCKTNLLTDPMETTFMPFFSETSFPKTLHKLIKCGEYNKTKKRSTPM